MLTKRKPNTREILTKDKRQAIADYILDYVKRNPGKQIPNGKIGAMCDTPAYNISTITKQLVRIGEIRQISRYTYAIVEKPLPLPIPQQMPLPPQAAPENIANQVEALAKDYMWQENGSGTLKGFIDWLKSE